MKFVCQECKKETPYLIGKTKYESESVVNPVELQGFLYPLPKGWVADPHVVCCDCKKKADAGGKRAGSQMGKEWVEDA